MVKLKVPPPKGDQTQKNVLRFCETCKKETRFVAWEGEGCYALFCTDPDHKEKEKKGSRKEILKELLALAASR